MRHPEAKKRWYNYQGNFMFGCGIPSPLNDHRVVCCMNFDLCYHNALPTQVLLKCAEGNTKRLGQT